jgi:hypothetical protein
VLESESGPSKGRQRSGRGEWGRTGVGKSQNQSQVEVGRGRAGASGDEQVWMKVRIRAE